MWKPWDEPSHPCILLVQQRWAHRAIYWVNSPIGLNCGVEAKEGERSMEIGSWALEACPTQKMCNQM